MLFQHVPKRFQIKAEDISMEAPRNHGHRRTRAVVFFFS